MTTPLARPRPEALWLLIAGALLLALLAWASWTRWWRATSPPGG